MRDASHQEVAFALLVPDLSAGERAACTHLAAPGVLASLPTTMRAAERIPARNGRSLATHLRASSASSMLLAEWGTTTTACLVASFKPASAQG